MSLFSDVTVSIPILAICFLSWSVACYMLLHAVYSCYLSYLSSCSLVLQRRILSWSI